ncbi:MAG TPA: hypothetical protein VL334_10825 [Anaerolineae bacterium]|nr:hypothetical protein [Anaerolineae bacterium]
MRRYLPIALSLALIVALLAVAPASAHRPYFEEEDILAARPWQINDPTISTVIYATLQSAGDVDYFAFDGRQGDRILLEITIPQIEGQEDFAPTMALLGPGLASAALPARVERPADMSGLLLLAPPSGPAATFFEPFSRTSYWERQSQRVTLPADGRYVVAVWHPTGEAGRYGFVIGDKERPGGDLSFMRKLRSYWTPVQLVSATPDAAPTDTPQDKRGNFWRLFGIR